MNDQWNGTGINPGGLFTDMGAETSGDCLRGRPQAEPAQRYFAAQSMACSLLDTLIFL